MARINLSHGTIKSNLKIINKFKLAKRLRPHKTCALMIETRGREVRMSHISAKTPTMRIRSGSSVTMFGGEFHLASDAQTLRIDNEQITRYFKPNDVVYFDDGKVVGIVTETNPGATVCKMEIKIGGYLKGNCAVRFTGGKHNNLQLVQKKDIDDIAAIS
jgi:pyruvate kinase|tara:strand:- start:1054 stop:1533 length:480 start_codon:yes stop_codon:yes gene_type:complete